MSDDFLEAFVSRVESSASFVNSLRPGLEHRVIAILQGKEFHNDEMPEILQIPEVLKKPGRERRVSDWAPRAMRNQAALPIQDHGNGVHTMVNPDQGVHFTLIVRTLKSEFEQFLNDPGVHCIYSGHARWGRGPCFGVGEDPGDEWEDGAAGNLATTGLFRMGFPYIGLPTNEIKDHGYQANLVTSDITMPRADCHPDLKPHLGRLRSATAATIDADLVPFVKDHDPAKTYWYYGAYDDGSRRRWVVLHAGWTNTTTNPHEIGAHNPTCRVFCHFGCSTFKHNYPIVRQEKGWTRDGNERYAYWTTGLADGTETVYWLQHLLEYDEWNAFESWEPSLNFALRSTRRDLARDGQRYRVI